MAGGWQVLFENSIDGVEPTPGSGVALLYQQRLIDELATKLDVTPLSKFFSRSPDEVAEYLHQQGLDPAKFDLPEEEWFEPDEGLTTVQALLAQLRAEPGSVPQYDKVVRDLEESERLLNVAMLHDVRFHLARTLSAPHE
jgi:hypothetical protein